MCIPLPSTPDSPLKRILPAGMQVWRETATSIPKHVRLRLVYKSIVNHTLPYNSTNMTLYKFVRVFVATVVFTAMFQSCKVEPEYYSQSVPELFFDTQQKVYQRMGRAFTHWAYNMTNGQAHANFIRLQEFTTDEMLVPSR